MKNLLIAIVILVASFTMGTAQTNNFEIELDPLAYSLGGASGHVAYTFKNERIQLGYGQLTLPKSFRNHQEITESFKSISLKWDYFFGKKNPSHGFFAGPTFDYLFLTYESETDEFKDNLLSIGLRGGYKFDLLKNSKTFGGLYLTPWVGVNWMTKSKDIELDNLQYDRKSVNFFPTIHLGWSF